MPTRIAQILLATDLTDRSERALGRALQLQGQTGAAILLLNVIEPGLMGGLEVRRRSDAESFLRDRIGMLPEEARRRCAFKVAVGDAFSTIDGEALAIGAGLVMLGEPGKYRYADLFVGTTAERVVRSSSVPVLMVKGEARQPYRRVLAPFDLSEGAMRALETALELAPDAQVRIVHAWRPSPAALGQLHAVSQAVREENYAIRELIERFVKERATGTGAPSWDINIDMVEDNPYVVFRNDLAWPDLIAVGTHARGKLATGTVGRLASHLLAEAPCDVLVARP
jgi:nucleotide-binding universal stress UspA family protein